MDLKSEKTIENLRMSQKLSNSVRDSMHDLHVVSSSNFNNAKEVTNPPELQIVQDIGMTPSPFEQQSDSHMLSIGITP